jgi:hypothetical protein
MTFKIKLLSAAALLALPAVAGAQTPTPQQSPQPGTTMDNVNQAVQQARDANPPAGEQVADEQPRQAEATPPQPAAQPPVNQDDAPPAPSATQAQPPAGTQTQPPAEQTQPPAQQAQPPAQANAQAQTSAQAQAGPVTAATAADVTAGAQVRDTAGAPVGTVESVDADSAVVSTGSVRADIPIASFANNNPGLVLAMTRTQLAAAARAAPRTPTS